MTEQEIKAFLKSICSLLAYQFNEQGFALVEDDIPVSRFYEAIDWLVALDRYSEKKRWLVSYIVGFTEDELANLTMDDWNGFYISSTIKPTMEQCKEKLEKAIPINSAWADSIIRIVSIQEVDR